MRHASLSTTLGIYAQYTSEGQRNAVKILMDDIDKKAAEHSRVVPIGKSIGTFWNINVILGVCKLLIYFGGASRDRTDDLIVANDALSQLSYSPTRGWNRGPDPA